MARTLGELAQLVGGTLAGDPDLPLTGAAPLLPRKAFGVWFSRYWPYSADDWKPLLERFRSEKVPLDKISLDTD